MHSLFYCLSCDKVSVTVRAGRRPAAQSVRPLCSVSCGEQLSSGLHGAPDQLPEGLGGQREAQTNIHPSSTLSSQERLHQRHHVVNTTRYIHHLPGDSHLTESHR